MRSVQLLTVVVLVALAVFVGKAWGGAGRSGDVVTRVDTVAPADYQDQLRAFYMERDGLRARLEGIENRAPEVIVITDTVITPPDTVYSFVNVDSRGDLTMEVLAVTESGSVVPDSTPIRYRPALHTGIDISDCDDGWQIRGGAVTCNRARLGHLWIGPELSRSPSFSLWWKPNLRSPWEIAALYNGNGWDFNVRRGVKIW